VKGFRLYTQNVEVEVQLLGYTVNVHLELASW